MIVNKQPTKSLCQALTQHVTYLCNLRISLNCIKLNTQHLRSVNLIKYMIKFKKINTLANQFVSFALHTA